MDTTWRDWFWVMASTLVVLCAMLLTGIRLSNAAEWDPASMNRMIDGTNFLVNQGCSGTLIDRKDGFVLTAAHCVLDQYEIVTRNKIGADGKVEEEKIRVAKPGTVSQKKFAGPNEVQTTSYVYKIVATDDRLDLSLLKVQTALPAGVEAQMACAPPERGDTVYAVGNPFGVLYSSVSKGIVGSVQRNYRDLQIAGQLGDATDIGEHGLVQHTALIAPGNSGGALFNDDGRFVGVNVRGGSGFSFAVPLDDVKAFLKTNADQIAAPACKQAHD